MRFILEVDPDSMIILDFATPKCFANSLTSPSFAAPSMARSRKYTTYVPSEELSTRGPFFDPGFTLTVMRTNQI